MIVAPIVHGYWTNLISDLAVAYFRVIAIFEAITSYFVPVLGIVLVEVELKNFLL